METTDTRGHETFRADPRQGVTRFLATHKTKILKSLVGIGLLALGLRTVNRSFIMTLSTEAFLARDFIDIVAPIEGVVTHSPLEVGAIENPGALLMTIANPRVNRTVVADLEAHLGALDGEISALQAVIQRLETVEGELKARGHVYQKERARYTLIQLEAAEAKLAADRARHVESQSRLSRTIALRKLGLAAQQVEDEARRDVAVDENTVVKSEREQAALRATLTALDSGFSLNEASSNDKAYSGQRQDDVALRLAQLRGDLAERRDRRPALATQLEVERKQFANLSLAEIRSPTRTLVLSVHVADGVYVKGGAPLLRMTDCSKARMIAYLPQRQFDRVRVGDRANIEMLESKRHYLGRVEALLGSPEARLGRESSVVATTTEAQRDRFGVLVASQELSIGEEGSCGTGQTAEILFGGGQR